MSCVQRPQQYFTVWPCAWLSVDTGWKLVREDGKWLEVISCSVSEKGFDMLGIMSDT